MNRKLKFAICSALTGVLFFSLNAFAFYDVPEEGRPPSVFSLCCCKLETHEGNQLVYSCKNSEIKECPQGTNNYDVPAHGCPSNLMFTKYN